MHTPVRGPLTCWRIFCPSRWINLVTTWEAQTFSKGTLCYLCVGLGRLMEVTDIHYGGFWVMVLLCCEKHGFNAQIWTGLTAENKLQLKNSHNHLKCGSILDRAVQIGNGLSQQCNFSARTLEATASQSVCQDSRDGTILFPFHLDPSMIY